MLAGAFRGRRACPPTVRAATVKLQNGAYLGLPPNLPREAGEVRAGVPLTFEPDLLSQIQSSGTMQTKAMIVKMFILLLSILET